MKLSEFDITPELLRKEAARWRGMAKDDDYDANSLADIFGRLPPDWPT